MTSERPLRAAGLDPAVWDHGGDKPRRSLMLLLLTLVAGGGAVLVAEPLRRPARAEQSREFQQLVGGLGFGPAADLERCAFSFDPRLCPGCPQQDGPVPAGALFCPYHGCAILAYPPLETIDHAPPP